MKFKRSEESLTVISNIKQAELLFCLGPAGDKSEIFSSFWNSLSFSKRRKARLRSEDIKDIKERKKAW